MTKPLPCPSPDCPDPGDVMVTECPINLVMYIVRCYACNAMGPTAASRYAAIAKWNALPREEPKS